MDCTTAKALDKWVKGAVLPAVGRLGGGVASLQVAAHYACRPRNSVAGAKLSEHGMGHAIDISAINLKNGISLSVLKGWSDAVQGRILRARPPRRLRHLRHRAGAGVGRLSPRPHPPRHRPLPQGQLLPLDRVGAW